ncbi:ornithine cyclodeaminase family protein [Minwuia sp.]|uniref:ornithine cyclodeaminase family protein n=1 Tax=Minwuia sp. TaxID=2493630 RepID=UPI003A91A406
MRIIDGDTVDRLLDETGLADALLAMFRDGCEQPVRHHHTVSVPDDPDATLLLMPAWQPGESLGIKVVTVFPGNSAQGNPAVLGQYLLLDARTGAPVALIDGTRLTAWRTAAASALAARFLARADSRRMVMVGSGALAPMLIRAHRAARPGLDDICIWNRNPDKAASLAETLSAEGLSVRPAGDLETEVRAADLISCATLSTAPIVRGDWLKQGAHLDLVGAFRPDMRESDDRAVERASVFVDTRPGASKEGGDIVQPLASGALQIDDIRADLHELSSGQHQGRSSDEEITLFKSVGAALEDLAAARLVAERLAPA